MVSSLWTNLLMKIAFCIGNGESRAGFNLQKLKTFGTLYGSNAVFRDVEVDHLVCCDRRMAMETVSKNYKGKVYTRKDWYSFFPYDNFQELPELPWEETDKHTQSFHMGSGLHSVNIALQNKEQILVIIGHDLWASGAKHNNMYKGTENYADTISPAIDPSFWIKQFKMFFELYPQKQFVFVQRNVKNWHKPPEWKDVPNLQYEELGGLLNALDQS